MAKQLLVGGVNSNLVTATRYLPFGSGVFDDFSSTLGDWESPIGVSGTISKLSVKLETAPGSSESRTFTLVKNGSDTAATVTISNTDTLAVDLTNSISVTAGDLLAIKSVGSTSPANNGWTTVSAILDTGAGTALHLGGGSDNASFAFGVFRACGFPGSDSSSSIFSHLHQWPPTIDCTISAFYMHLTDAAGGDFPCRMSASTGQVSSFTITSGNKDGSETGLSYGITAGDWIQASATRSSGIQNNALRWACAYIPDTPGEQMLGFSDGGSAATGSVEYRAASGKAETNWETTQRPIYFPEKVTLSNLRAGMVTAPGSGKSWTYDLLIDGSPSNLNLVIADTATNGADTTNTDVINAGSLVTVRITPASTPSGQTRDSWGITLALESTHTAAARRRYTAMFPTMPWRGHRVLPGNPP
jgi:hypothetical protein